MSRDKAHVVDCHCTARDHNITFDYFDAWGEELIVGATLNHYLPMWKRALIGLKYILGMDNTHVHYVETILDKERIIKLRDFLNDAIADIELNEAISNETQPE